MAEIHSGGTCIELDLRRKYYEPREVAEELGISVRRVRRLLAKGEIKGVKLGNAWLITKAAITDWRGCKNGQH